jgi:Response regulator containing a CheY-like receiver domain and an HTH DNA-binding domain
MTSTLKVLLADDDPILLDKVHGLLDSLDDIEVVAAVSDGCGALSALDEHEVDVALLDVDMPELDGIKTTEKIVAGHPDVTVVMLTAFEHQNSLKKSLAVGAKGFLTKDTPIETIAGLLHRARAGEAVFDSRPKEILVESYRGIPDNVPDQDFLNKIESLTPRHKEALDLLVEAASNKEIAQTMGLSEGTVRLYVSEVLATTACKSRAEVAVKALRAGYRPKKELSQ